MTGLGSCGSGGGTRRGWNTNNNSSKFCGIIFIRNSLPGVTVIRLIVVYHHRREFLAII